MAFALCEGAVADALGLGVAEFGALVFLIFRVGAFVEHHFAVAFKREDVSADAVEEPTVVRYHNGTSCKVLETLFESAESVHVDIVGRFVEEEHVAFFFQCHGEVEAVALTTREHADFLLLVGTCEVKLGEVCSGVHVSATHAESLDTL